MELKKPIFFYSIIVFVLIIGCKSEQITMQDYTVEKDIFLHINQEFMYSLGSGISIEGGYTINTQAKKFDTSEIQLNKNGGLTQQYIYKPKINFVGDDFVILQNCISIGGAGCDKIELFKFNFHIE